MAVLAVAISALFAYFAVRDVHWDAVWDGLRSSNYLWLVPSLALLAVTVFLKAVRWRLVFAPATRPPLLPVTSSSIIGHFFNTVLPARAGEAARVAALRWQAKTSAVEAAGTVVSERILDVLVLLALLFVASPFLPPVSWIEAATVLAAIFLACVLLLVVVLAFYGNRPFEAIVRLLARIPRVPAEPLERAADNLVRGLMVFRQPRMAAVVIPVTVMSWLALALSFWLVMIGFDLEIGFGAGLLVVIATNLVLIVPSSPGGVGVFEAATVVALNAYGIDDSAALSYAVVMHAANLIPSLIVGYAVLHWHVYSARRLRHASISPGAPPPTTRVRPRR